MKFLQLLKNNASKIGFEFTSIFFGVMIALMLNNWSEQNKEEEYAHELLDKLEIELKENAPNIASLLEDFKHNITLTTKNIQTLQQPSATTALDEDYAFEMRDIKAGVWKFATNRSALNELPVELLLNISYAYEQQIDAKRAYTDFMYNTIDNIVSFSPSISNAERLIMLKTLNRELQQMRFQLFIAAENTHTALTAIAQYKREHQLI